MLFIILWDVKTDGLLYSDQKIPANNYLKIIFDYTIACDHIYDHNFLTPRS